MNGYTTIEQSKKLIKLGLDPETADMSYRWCICKCINGEPVEDWLIELGKPFDECPDEQIPAWSLSALLDLMPIHIVHSTGNCYYTHFIMDEVDFLLYIDKNREGYEVTYSTSAIDMDGSRIYEDCYKVDKKKDFIDAAFEMVCWLLENKKGYIKTK